jgi:hypothetical protein
VPLILATGNRDAPLAGLVTASVVADRPQDAQLHLAIHASAHAVAAEACGLGYPSLRLSPAPASGGCGFLPNRDTRGRGPARNGIEAAVIASLAGAEAEHLAGIADPVHCADIAPWLTDGSPTEAEPYIEWLRLKAASVVEHPLRQRVIVALTVALLEREMLTPEDVATIALAETARYMRGQ